MRTGLRLGFIFSGKKRKRGETFEEAGRLIRLIWSSCWKTEGSGKKTKKAIGLDRKLKTGVARNVMRLYLSRTKGKEGKRGRKK